MTDPNHERFSRVARLFGEDGMKKLTAARVVVVGLGAVGSYAVEGLARAGVGNLRLVDFDKITISNINRQLYALESTIGQQKCEAAKSRVLDINPHCNVEAMDIFAHVETFDTIFGDRPDLVIDAIDSVNPKFALIAEVGKRKLPTISSMGAALKTDPSFIRTDLLSKTSHCHLARIIRKRLRRHGLESDPLCVYSTEPKTDLPETAIAPLEESDAHVIDRGRARRTMGSLPTITGIFGLTIANLALQILLTDEM